MVKMVEVTAMGTTILVITTNIMKPNTKMVTKKDMKKVMKKVNIYMKIKNHSVK